MPIDEMRVPDEKLMQGDIIKQLPGQKSTNPTPYKSVATMDDETITDAAIGQPDILRGMVSTIREDQLPGHQKSILDDTLEARREGKKPRQTGQVFEMSGQPGMFVSNAFAIGDKVMHRDREKAGTIVDISMKKGLEVQCKNDKKTHFWDPKKCVKI